MDKTSTLNFLAWHLKIMQQLAEHPERDKFCADFDTAYARRKKVYEALAGRPWKGADRG